MCSVQRGIRYTGEQTLCNSIFNRILCPMAFGIRKYCVSLYLNAVVAAAAICIQTEMREEIIPTISDTSACRNAANLQLQYSGTGEYSDCCHIRAW